MKIIHPEHSNMSSLTPIALMKKHPIMAALIMVSVLMLSVSCADNNGDLVIVKVDTPPIPILSEGKMNIAYGVDFSDYTQEGLKLVKAQIINSIEETVIESYTDSILDSHLVMTSSPLPTEQEKWDGTKKQAHPVLFVWLKLEPSAVPEEISHEFTFVNEWANNKEVFKNGAVVQVRNIHPVTISPPMEGQGWVSMETTELLTHHFKNEVTYKGEEWHPERYAVDYLQIDSDNNFFVGDERQNKNWVCYGKELIAVADGIVTATHDGVPENYPADHTSPDLKVRDMAGNYVIIDVGDNHFVAYCHMIPGSIKVSVGKTVAKGDVLGLIGNSGMSTAPHLHFQITDGNSFIGSEGLPYVLDAFTLTGYATLDQKTDDFIISKYQAPIHKENELMENLRVLNFK